ncbi:hypothetical protein ATCC90586_001930 [Pythium insidiosum]|nr:hypothetical protein ATCC90586_001930 [Pythium insidiosum]
MENANPEESPSPSLSTRRQHAFSTLQLQRAADELQDAILSVRRRRSSARFASSSTSLLSSASSLMSPAPSPLRYAVESSGDQENQANRRNALPASDASASKQPLLQSPLGRRHTLGSASDRHRYDRRLRVEDLKRSPACHSALTERSTHDVRHTGGTLSPQASRHRLLADDAFEREAVTAIHIVQEQVEQQARENRASMQQIRDAMAEIDAFVMEFDVDKVGDDESRESELEVTQPVDASAIEKRCRQWLRTLQRWKDNEHARQREREEQYRMLAEDFSSCRVHKRMEAMERATHELTEQLARQATELERWQENDCLHMKTLAAREARRHALEREQAQMHREDWRSARLAQEQVQAQDSARERRDMLALLTQLKQTELRELQWQDAYTHQTQAAVHLEERLLMLQEDCRSWAGRCDVASEKEERPRRSSSACLLSSDCGVSELAHYQQKIELLEAQLLDARQQIRCDHEQFVYEQTKWSVEKKHLSKDVEEIHDVSAKVLKVLLLREKLLKRKERQVQRRLDEVATVAATALAVLDGVTQETAVTLVHLRQVAVATAPGATTNAVQERGSVRRIARQIKRLQLLRGQLGALSSAADGDADGAANADADTDPDAGGQSPVRADGSHDSSAVCTAFQLETVDDAVTRTAGWGPPN